MSYNTADMTGGKPIINLIAAYLRCECVLFILQLGTFYFIHRRKVEVIFFSYVPNTTIGYRALQGTSRILFKERKKSNNPDIVNIKILNFVMTKLIQLGLNGILK
jgi:hypothetical protein